MFQEKGLVDGIRKGDESSFKKVHQLFYPRLYYFVLEFIPQSDLVENIIQETFMTLWQKREALLENTNLGAYLFTVAKNNCLTRLRDQKYCQKLFVNEIMDESELELNRSALLEIDSSAFVVEEIEQIIQETLAQLPPQCRRVFEMSRFKEMKNREIAEELDISIKVVEKHMTRALKTFRTALKDYIPFVAYLLVP
ncbi:RNA polymerase sigma-70 factor [Prolixibacteraceae bacterium JC049]|nr:RNA polymerase sigma-70 factor [Prolixibacteraceae bacterium JC049]